MKKQVVIIHGGETFNSYEDYLAFLKGWIIDFEKEKTKVKKWKESLGERLGEEFEVIVPSMPSKLNAKYLEWKIWFEKYVPYLEEEVVLVGHSLGGTFLAKYLAENELPRKIRGVFLIAAPYEGNAEYSLTDFCLPDSLAKLAYQAANIFLYHSEDDPVVPFADLNKYQKALPLAQVRIFKDREHFNQEELPELISDIKNLFR